MQAALAVSALGAAALAWIICWHTGSALAAVCGVFGSHTVLYRLHMCRPHTLAIPLVVLGVALLARRSRRSAAAVNLVYTLSYSVPVVILGAATVQALMQKDLRSWAWILGASAAGVLLHPHFPQSFWLLGYQGVAVISNAARGNPLGVRLPDELLPWHAGEFLAEFWLPLGLLLLALALRREPRWLLVLLVLSCLAAFRMRRLAEYWAPLTGLCVGSTLRWALPDRSLLGRGALAALIVLATVPMNTHGARATTLEQRTGMYRGAGEWLRANAQEDRVFNAEWDAYAELRYFSPESWLAQGQDPVFVAGFDKGRHELVRRGSAGQLGAAELRRAFQCRFFLYRRTALPLPLEVEPGVQRRFTDGRVVLLELPERWGRRDGGRRHKSPRRSSVSGARLSVLRLRHPNRASVPATRLRIGCRCRCARGYGLRLPSRPRLPARLPPELSVPVCGRGSQGASCTRCAPLDAPHPARP